MLKFLKSESGDLTVEHILRLFDFGFFAINRDAAQAVSDQCRKQVEQIIDALVIVEIDGIRLRNRPPAFAMIDTSVGRYEPTDEAVMREAHRNRVLDDARRELRDWREKYQGIQELADIVLAVSMMEEERKYARY
jgi:hypothetical protein